jgi:hypothetical protein
MAAGEAFIGGVDIAVSLYLVIRPMTSCDVNRVKAPKLRIRMKGK